MRKSMRAVDAGATRGISQRTAACDAPPTAVAAAVTAASPRSNRLPAGSASQRRTKHQTGGHRGRPEQEAVMGKWIPKQPPGRVLRSYFNLVRALLGVAMIALVGLTIALVVVANDDNDSGSTSAVQAAPAAPALPAYPSPEAVSRGLHTAPIAPDTRYDGGPEEGSRGPLTSRVAPDTRYDGGPEEGTRGPGFSTD